MLEALFLIYTDETLSQVSLHQELKPKRGEKNAPLEGASKQFYNRKYYLKNSWVQLERMLLHFKSLEERWLDVVAIFSEIFLNRIC